MEKGGREAREINHKVPFKGPGLTLASGSERARVSEPKTLHH